jgi:hypothetical protein
MDVTGLESEGYTPAQIVNYLDQGATFPVDNETDSSQLGQGMSPDG